MSGTAEMVADELALRLEAAGRASKIIRMEKSNAASLAQAGTWLICSSTYGTGDVPDNGRALYQELQSKRPDLSQVRYGVVALGNSIYPNTFCFGGRKFDELFTELGATRIGDRLQLDSSGPVFPEDAAVDWIKGWLPLERVK